MSFSSGNEELWSLMDSAVAGLEVPSRLTPWQRPQLNTSQEVMEEVQEFVEWGDVYALQSCTNGRASGWKKSDSLFCSPQTYLATNLSDTVAHREQDKPLGAPCHPKAWVWQEASTGSVEYNSGEAQTDILQRTQLRSEDTGSFTASWGLVSPPVEVQRDNPFQVREDTMRSFPNDFCNNESYQLRPVCIQLFDDTDGSGNAAYTSLTPAADGGPPLSRQRTLRNDCQSDTIDLSDTTVTGVEEPGALAANDDAKETLASARGLISPCQSGATDKPTNLPVRRSGIGSVRSPTCFCPWRQSKRLGPTNYRHICLSCGVRMVWGALPQEIKGGCRGTPLDSM